ncbi:unnamed protein product, partial [Discosporangium mesarthrocarpum]
MTDVLPAPPHLEVIRHTKTEEKEEKEEWVSVSMASAAGSASSLLAKGQRPQRPTVRGRTRSMTQPMEGLGGGLKLDTVGSGGLVGSQSAQVANRGRSGSLT